MRVFMTGASGQLGRELMRVFAQEEIYGSRHAQEDITQPQIIATIRDFQPDVIIHAAAMTDVDACELHPELAFRVNEQGTRHVAEAARQTDALLVYVSTDYVFDGAKGAPYVETDPTRPLNVYGHSKLAGECAAQEAGRWLIVRTAWLYGAGSRNFVRSVLEWAKTQSVLKLVDDKVGSPTYVKDLAMAIRHLLDTGIMQGVFHAAGAGACTWFEYGQTILKMAGIQKEVQPIVFEELHRPAPRPMYSALGNAALAQCSFTMRPWAEALHEFLTSASYRQVSGVNREESGRATPHHCS
jgi:dTDP-4-dehydrorhamnose reductase